MVRHVVLFRFKPETTDEQRRALLEQQAGLPARFPAMRRFGLGENISQRDQAFSHVMTIEFDERQQLEDYLNSPEHEHFVATRFWPLVEERAIASYEAT